MLAPTALLLGLFFLYPLALAVKHELLRVGSAHAARLRRGAATTRALVVERRARGHRSGARSATASIVVALSVVARPRARASRSNRPGRVYAFVRGAVFSAYVVSWVAVALLWMWILDADRGLVSSGAPRARPADPELARRSGRRARHARARQRLEDHRLRDGHLPRRACRTSRRRSTRPPRSTARAPSRRFVHVTWPLLRPSAAFVGDDEPHPLVPGLRRGARDDPGRAREVDDDLRLRHLRARLREPARRPRERAHRRLLRPAARAHRPCSSGAFRRAPATGGRA